MSNFTYLSWGVGCFAKGTPVLTPDGYKPIDKLVVGDIVTAFDGEQVHACPVEFVSGACNQPKPMIQFMYDETKDPIRATYDHPFYDGERYYPLYQFIWGDLEASQRLQLKLLCEQYGQIIDNTPSRGISHSDTQTWERPIWSFEDSDERTHNQSPSSCGSDLDIEPKQFTYNKSQGLRPDKQSDNKSGVVYAETEQPTRLQTGEIEQLVESSAEGEEKELHNKTMSSDMGLVETKNTRSGKEQPSYPNKSIHRITETLSRDTDEYIIKYSALPIRLHSIQILPAEPYYAIGVKDIYTYIVHDLPVHNTGKTKEALDRAVASGCKAIVVYAPPVLKTMKHWEREAEKWGVTIPMQVFTYYQLQQYSKGLVSHLLPDEGEHIAIMFDEAHKLKNSQSQQGLGAFKLIRDNPKAHFYLLSGTPAPNGYADFCNYAKMTGFVKNKTDFYKRYVIQSDFRGFPEITGYRNTDELNKWWREVANIKPPITFTEERDIWVDFPAVMDEVYAKKTRVGRMDGVDYILENASQLTHYCRQIVSLTKVRRDWLENLLESTDENIVVFVGYTRVLNEVVEIANKLKKRVYRVDGAKKLLPDDSETPTLKNAVIVVNYQAGGAGLNIQYANHAVFYTPTYSYSDYIQARGRISRRGQERHCTFYHLQADRSIEHDIYNCLKRKEDFSIKLWNKQYAQEDNVDVSIL